MTLLLKDKMQREPDFYEMTKGSRETVYNAGGFMRGGPKGINIKIK